MTTGGTPMTLETSISIYRYGLIISWSITCYKNHPLSQETIPPKSPKIGGMCTILNCVVYYIVKKPALVLIPIYIYIHCLSWLIGVGFILLYPGLSHVAYRIPQVDPSRSILDGSAAAAPRLRQDDIMKFHHPVEFEWSTLGEKLLGVFIT